MAVLQAAKVAQCEKLKKYIQDKRRIYKIQKCKVYKNKKIDI